MIEIFLRDLRQPEYIHVLLNPLPVYGLALALFGLLIAICFRSRGGRMITLVLVLVTAAAAWPVYELGEQSSDRVLSMSDDDGRAWLEEHQNRAERLIPFFYVLAAISLAAMVIPARFAKSALILAVATLLFGCVVLGIGGYIAQAGGKIRHREFRTVLPPKQPNQTD